MKDVNISGSPTTMNNNCSTALSQLFPYNRKYRTKQEIYNEIVCECAELEKNKVSKGFVLLKFESII